MLSTLSAKDRNSSSFRNVVFFRIPDEGRSPKIQQSQIVDAVYVVYISRTITTDSFIFLVQKRDKLALNSENGDGCKYFYSCMSEEFQLGNLK
jgi:hypothetical protein